MENKNKTEEKKTEQKKKYSQSMGVDWQRIDGLRGNR